MVLNEYNWCQLDHFKLNLFFESCYNKHESKDAMAKEKATT
jgi:hypothetical protein